MSSPTRMSSSTRISSPTTSSNDRRLSNSSMDPAEFIQNIQHFITFPRTDTTWKIESNITDTHENPELKINSFLQPVVFKVVIGSIGSRKSMEGIPRTAIMKVQSLLHIVTKHNKDKKHFDRKTIMATEAREELIALNRLTMNECSCAPTLLDYKVTLHDECPGREVYVSYILVTEITGIRLTTRNFWMLPQVERDMVRQAFRKALSEIHAAWVKLDRTECRDLIWNLQEGKMYVSPPFSHAVPLTRQFHSYFTRFAPSQTYGITEHLPSYYCHQWHDIWFWWFDLTTKNFINPSDLEVDPSHVATRKHDDGSDIAAWDFPYPANGIRPKWEEVKEEIIERVVDKAVVEDGEIVKEKKKRRSWKGRVREVLGLEEH
ncbi:hypothetical protein BLS_001792 [Venturia inaequalis]|uniref:Uncharacterized protein n=1 Tax=Venturia inaequalis TaxID=5025 RepID=A0A8H3U214_VENIN|nr:hypothetical protein BLS_001792 [Venturia inaequalis]